jgi:hypothetical protein
VWQFLLAISERDLVIGALLCVNALQAFLMLGLFRRSNCTAELLERANERIISTNNETSRIHLHAYVAGVRPLLSDLAHERVDDWELTFDEGGDTSE